MFQQLTFADRFKGWLDQWVNMMVACEDHSLPCEVIWLSYSNVKPLRFFYGIKNIENAGLV